MSADPARPLRAAVTIGAFLVLATPLVVAPFAWPRFVLPGALYARMVILFAAALWAALALADRRYRPPRSAILAAVGVYLVVNLAAAAAGVSLDRSLWSTPIRMGGIIGLAHWSALIVVLSATFRTQGRWRWLLAANAVVGLLVVAVGLGKGLGLAPLIRVYHEAGDRMIATIGNPAYLAGYVTVSLLLALALLASPPARHVAAWRGALLVAAAVFGWALLQTATRGAAVGLGAGLAAWATAYALWGGRRLPRLAASGALVLLVVLAGLGWAARDLPVMDGLRQRSPLAARLLAVSPEDPTTATRVEFARAGLAAFRERPLLGWGPENAEQAFERQASERFFRFSREWGDRLHNRVVDELVERGAVGLLAYLALWAVLLRAVIQRARGQRGREGDAPGSSAFAMGIGAALVAYFVQNLFLFDTVEGMLQLSLLVGFLAAPRDAPSGGRHTLTGRAVWAVVAAAIILAALAGSYLHLPPYRQAVQMGAAMRSRWMADRLRLAEQAYAVSPPMANMARIALFRSLMDGRWAALPRSRSAVLALVDRQMPLALASEPGNAPLPAAAAVLYVMAAASDPAYLDGAAYWVREAATRMSPHRPLTGQLQEGLRRLEERGGRPKPAGP